MLLFVVDKDGWQKVKGRFIAINAFCMSCKCGLSPEGTSPCCHLGDGCLDLVLVRECSRADYVKHLMKVTSKTADQVKCELNETSIKDMRHLLLYGFSLPNCVWLDASTPSQKNMSGEKNMYTCMY